MTVFYKKEGRRYIPIRQYDDEFMDAHPQGASITICNIGSKMTRYGIDPAIAPIMAAGMLFREDLLKELVKASEAKVKETRELTPEEKEAWDNLIRVFGDRARVLEYNSLYEVATLAVQRLEIRTQELLTNPTVKDAYEQFIAMSKLTKETCNG